jgi:hypothetical protein
MKKVEKLKSGAALSRLMEVEGTLARAKARQLEEDLDGLPDDDPAKVEARRQKMMLGGDLAGLPPGHPLLKILEEAKLRYESGEKLSAEERAEKQSGPAVRKAKRLDLKKKAAQERAEEESKTQRRRAAAKGLKGAMETMLVSVRTFKDVALQSSEAFKGDVHSVAKIQRLLRMSVAVEKWITDGLSGAGRMA